MLGNNYKIYRVTEKLAQLATTLHTTANIPLLISRA